MRWFFAFFFVSGFCSILYEVIWLRLSMAQFGVTSALVAIVLSTFMAGMGLGLWGSGYLIRYYGDKISPQALRFYALIELLIGNSAILVPYQLGWGRDFIEYIVPSSSWTYYIASGTWIGLTLMPWCVCMGATIPIAMLAMKNYFYQTSQSFSYLYLANVLGAAVGAMMPLLLIELYGFRNTLHISAAMNVLLAFLIIGLGLFLKPISALTNASVARVVPSQKKSQINALNLFSKPLLLLFLTGLTSMGMELIWIRQFTPYLGTVVYSFAFILAVYLIFTFIGSRLYLRHGEIVSTNKFIWVLLGFFALLPLWTTNAQWNMPSVLRLILGIGPFSALLGFMTPLLVDRWSSGDPSRAGYAYAVNVLGCILGPLLAGFLLLPLLSEHRAVLLLALPWFIIGVFSGRGKFAPRRVWQEKLFYMIIPIVLLVAGFSKGYEGQFFPRTVLRDDVATVIAVGEGMKKRLLVNGIGITVLTPITKMMAHLPMLFLDHVPTNSLVICFGMGTTFRSLLSWGVSTTAVELVPSVPKMFGYYHLDASQLLYSPLSHIVIDDGRRYLERVSEQYDVITLDPPPPVEAMGSSLLYSKEFYGIVKKRLKSHGILQQWLPGGDVMVQSAVARALIESFPYVRVFRSIEGSGFHFIASSYPIQKWDAHQLAKRLPANAVKDIIEWGPTFSAEQNLAIILNHELSIAEIVANAPQAVALQDDWPVNEYYFFRHIF